MRESRIGIGMRTAEAFNNSRVGIAWRNVRANRRMRPVDMINGFQMVQPLSALARHAAPAIPVPLLVYDILTRLQVTYKPQPVSDNPAYAQRQLSLRRTDQPRVGLFADAPDHLSGVCKTLAEWKHQADLARCDLTLHGCGVGSEDQASIVSFRPVGSISIEAYEGLTLNVPRVTEVMDYIRRAAFDVIHVSTPGPMGLLGLLAGRQLGIPVCGTYHTDFPRYAATLTGKPEFEEIGWALMSWFYGQLDRVAAPTRSIRDELIAHGLNEERIHVVGRGVETSRFSPAHRDEDWRKRHGARYPVKLLYVGRISREKNLETLVDSFIRLRKTRPDVCLVVVGDGPYRSAMQDALRGTPAYFTGSLNGEALARAYASCDLFAFPSKTDTYGRVVLEAQASGVPVVVSDCGGPKDAMEDRATGLVVPDLDAESFAHAIDCLTDNPAQLAAYGKAARRYAGSRTLRASFEEFWSLHQFSKQRNNRPQGRILV